ncbi:hypothetical protein Y032_0842g2636 [Ancylostoma ceylanicum]|uniref:Uncharacterized protein n=1 Tax=Ancylostoma ceylanicum TaxID=53326 RepID=A0A016WD52_9BILA|nr:hypothetical protein Y032_0842g2636 [Ancylostoma ceylanicum]
MLNHGRLPPRQKYETHLSRLIVIFVVSANDLAVTWATWKLTAYAPPLDLRPLWRPRIHCTLLLFLHFCAWTLL